jgi:hypothetical protein
VDLSNGVDGTAAIGIFDKLDLAIYVICFIQFDET